MKFSFDIIMLLAFRQYDIQYLTMSLVGASAFGSDHFFCFKNLTSRIL